jgi:hypothetical protein
VCRGYCFYDFSNVNFRVILVEYFLVFEIEFFHSLREAITSFTCNLWLTSTVKRKLVEAWILIHEDKLMADWELAINGEEVSKIDPLK